MEKWLDYTVKCNKTYLMGNVAKSGRKKICGNSDSATPIMTGEAVYDATTGRKNVGTPDKIEKLGCGNVCKKLGKLIDNTIDSLLSRSDKLNGMVAKEKNGKMIDNTIDSFLSGFDKLKGMVAKEKNGKMSDNTIDCLLSRFDKLNGMDTKEKNSRTPASATSNGTGKATGFVNEESFQGQMLGQQRMDKAIGFVRKILNKVEIPTIVGKKGIAVCIAVAAGTTACTWTHGVGNEDIVTQNTQQQEVTLGLVTDEEFTVTKATINNTNLETYIDDVAVLVFNADNGQYLYTAPSTLVEENKKNVVKTKLNIDNAGATFINIHVLTNAGAVLNKNLTGKTLNDITQLLTLTLDKNNNNNVTQFNNNNPVPIPMWGRLDYVRVTTKNGLVYSNNQAANTNIKLLRMIAKIDVSTSANVNGRLGQVFFYNHTSTGQLIPNNNALDQTANCAVKAPSVPSNAKKTIVDSIVYNSNNNKATIYSFEAAKSTPAEDEIFEKYITQTCLVVEIIKNDENNNEKYCYYRVDFVNNSGRLNILRNNHYNVIIKNVLSDGEKTPREALESKFNNNDSELTVDEFTYVDGGVIDWEEPVDLGDSFGGNEVNDDEPDGE
jgi:hypothetical protein